MTDEKKKELNEREKALKLLPPKERALMRKAFKDADLAIQQLMAGIMRVGQLGKPNWKTPKKMKGAK